MNIIQKYKTYKDLKNYLDKNCESVELVTECPKVDICRKENNYCFYGRSIYKSCMSYEIKTDGLSMTSVLHRNRYRRPMDDVQFRVNVVNKGGVLPNTPEFIAFIDKILARHIYNLFADAYRRKLVAGLAKFYHR